jgi:uncharacterized delta-60 repeat protein
LITLFSGDGKQTTDFASGDDVASSIAIQSNGKIVVAGTTETVDDNNFALARYNTDGTLDKSFSFDRKQTTDVSGYDRAAAVAIQSNGKIVVAGSTGDYGAIVRFNTNGSLDTTFSNDGKQSTDFETGIALCIICRHAN